MSIDINKTIEVYNSLVQKVTDTLDLKFNLERLDNEHYADVITKVIETLVTTSITSVQQQELIDAQVKNYNAQIALTNNQADKVASDKTIAEDQSAKDLSVKQAQIDEMKSHTSLLDAQEADQVYITGKIRPEELALDEAKVSETNTQINLYKAQIKQVESNIVSQSVEDRNRVKTTNKDIEVKEAQRQMYIRQKQGFDDKLKMDLTKMQLDNWSMMFSSGLLDKKPDIISNDDVSLLYGDITSGLSILASPTLSYIEKCNVKTGYVCYIENYDSDASYSVSSTNGVIQKTDSNKNLSVSAEGKIDYYVKSDDSGSGEIIVTVSKTINGKSFTRVAKANLSWTV